MQTRANHREWTAQRTRERMYWRRVPSFGAGKTRRAQRSIDLRRNARCLALDSSALPERQNLLCVERAPCGVQYPRSIVDQPSRDASGLLLCY